MGSLLMPAPPKPREDILNTYFGLDHEVSIRQRIGVYLKAHPGYRLLSRYIGSATNYKIIMAKACIMDQDDHEVCQAIAVGDDPFMTERQALLSLLDEMAA